MLERISFSDNASDMLCGAVSTEKEGPQADGDAGRLL